MRHLRIASVVLAICIVMIVPLAYALPDPGENGTGDSSDGGIGGEKPVVARTPLSPGGDLPEPTEIVPQETTTPEDGDEKDVTEKAPPSPALEEVVPADAEPLPEEMPATAESTPERKVTQEPDAPAGAAEETMLLSFPAMMAASANDTAGEEPEEEQTGEPSENETDTQETAEYVDDPDDEEEEEETEETAAPTLERFAPPRPNATMAKAHKYHDQPLVQSGHQLVGPATPYTPERNETGTGPVVAVARDGLLVKGVGVLLDRTPEDVALTRSGVEIANLDWLLDPAMHLWGRHPRAAFEGETFTVTVTVEARNLTAIGEGPAYVVLVPPPEETGIYEITRTREPRSLEDGERGVWEFSVATRTGRLTLANLTLPEERLITNLTSNPDVFAFRAYAFIGDQAVPSTGVSDPVLAIRPDGDPGAAEDSPLPELYAYTGIPDSTLRPSETMAGAWARGVDHDTIVAGAIGHFEALGDLGLEELVALYDLQGEAGEGESSASSSLFDWIIEFFQGLFG